MPSYYRDPIAPKPNRPRGIGVTALIERDGQVLVERRADDPDVWAFIGGTLGDESVLDALQREVREETSFEIEHATLLGIFSDPTRIVAYPDGSVLRVASIAFLVSPVGNDEPVLSHESAEMRFVTRRELVDLPFWPVQVPVREAFLADPATPVVA